ncbi:MAG: choice-of-anchor D domain-containing protein [Planctomycetota bacterium]|jgi:hypothetical protein
MESTVLNRKSVCVCAVLLAAIVWTPSVTAGIVCGQEFEFITGEAEPVDIACATGDVYVMDGTANLVTGGQVVNFYGMEGCTINVYGGTVTGSLDFVTGVLATVYTASVEPIEGILAEGDTQIINNGASILAFDLVGTYQDGTSFTIPCALQAGAVLNLDVPQTAPEIDVLPALLAYDFGDVAIGETVTYVAHISNIGTADLQVTSLALDVAGSVDFSISAAPEVPFTVAPSESIVVDIEITYTPSAEDLDETTLMIASDDEDEPLVEVAFMGVGIVVEVPPTEQIQAILDLFDASVADGTLLGYGPGNSSSKRLKALRNMLESASSLIVAEAYDQAIKQLGSIAKKTDGQKRPPDFVVGESTAMLNQMVTDLIVDLTL